MTAARCLALTICAFGIAPGLAAPPVMLGDPFHIRHGESVELTRGTKLRLIGVNEGRCAIGMTSVWQGEAHIEFELPLYLLVATSKAPKDAFDQVHGSDFIILPCEVTLLDETAHGGCNSPTR